ncbi:MAG: glycosyltransferase [Pseudodesulfovibrio sp.]|nr:glycosyltransferase [Pseudodesulfovibrio sp.]
MPRLPAIFHHTGLESTGGATRVARLIMDGLSPDFETGLSFELAEKADAAAILPEEFGQYLPEDALPHIHCTGNWPALLASIPEGRKTIITLHDCELFTGGCPYPLGCSAIEEECVTPCPRNFPNSEELRKTKFTLLKRLDPVLVAPSRWLSRLAKKHLHQSVTIIPNGIPWTDRPGSKKDARQKLGINPAARVALFAAHGGMNAAYKSGTAWKSLWEGIKAQLPEALCFAVGGDKAGRYDDLVVWPYVKRDRLRLLMTAADVMLYPTKADNHSLVILEAMAQALPVIAYAVGGVPEQIIDQSTGLLISPGNKQEFINEAAVLLGNPMRCRDLGQTAFAAGKKRFSADRMVTDYIKLYTGTIS